MFYRAVLEHIEGDTVFEGAAEKIIALAIKAKPSWEATLESVAFLEKCSNSSGGVEVEDDHIWSLTLNDFVKAAFRDLSPLKDPGAMDLFNEVANKIGTSFRFGNDMFVWTRSVKKRPDGSGVLVIHVTDMDRLRRIIEKHRRADEATKENSLEFGVLIGS